MNNISILFLLADWCGTIKELAAICAVLLGAGLGLMAIIRRDRSIMVEDIPNPRKFLPLLLILTFLGIAIPSHKTIYFIMASEVSEETMKSETGKRVVEAIQKRLDEYLSEDEE